MKNWTLFADAVRNGFHYTVAGSEIYLGETLASVLVLMGVGALFIKAKRIRTLEVTGESLVGEGILPEFMALINYGIIGLIQLRKGYADKVDMTNDEAMALYDEHARECLELMQKKNHDYGEAWRDMRVSSYTDIILTKLERIKEIEDKNGVTIASEGIDSNIMDIINYSVFAVIKLSPLPQEA